MPLIKDNSFQTDHWQHQQNETEMPAADHVILNYEYIVSNIETITKSQKKIGVLFPNDQDVSILKPYLDHLDLIALQFPKFADGRAYSQARLLREDLGFTGELRATGDVLPDQAALMMRCGFDAFEVSDKVALETWTKASEALSNMYQRSYAVSGDVVRIE